MYHGTVYECVAPRCIVGAIYQSRKETGEASYFTGLLFGFLTGRKDFLKSLTIT